MGDAMFFWPGAGLWKKRSQRGPSGLKKLKEKEEEKRRKIQ
jgi:hypothetical protein